MTLPGFQPLTVLAPPVTYTGLLITGTEQAIEISQAIEQAFVAGTIASGVTKMGTLPNGEPGWMVQLTIDGVLYTGYQFDWLILGSDNTLRICSGASAQPGSISPPCAALYSTDTPLIWSTAAPSVTVSGAVATLEFPQPTSANAPFTYTVTDNGEPVAVTSETVTEGTVSLQVSAATGSHSFEVTVTTEYDGVTATTSPASVSV